MANVELASVYLDAVVMDNAATGLQLINRNPDVNETGVPVNHNIELDIASITGNAVDTVATQVFVDIDGGGEVLAFDGNAGGFQTGFTGPESATSNPDTNTLRIVLDPNAPFQSIDVVVVRVVSADVGATASIDSSYSFTIADITPAAVTAASAQDLKVVRISFDEAVKQVLATEADDALNPSNYAFAPLEFPGVTPVAESVSAVSATSVDVTVDIEFSMGKQYQVTVTGVADLQGNLT